MSEIEITKRTGPSMNRGSSKQDYATPRPFIAAVEKRFGPLSWDLAAHAENTVCGSMHFGPDMAPEYQDSLAVDWNPLGGNLWLNPPFADIAPWAAKCEAARNRRAWTLLLVPASVGSNWFAEHVMDKALTLWLSPRLAFNGESYPKDLMLAAFGFGVRGSDRWRWNEAFAAADSGAAGGER